jgi:hypothetical protein
MFNKKLPSIFRKFTLPWSLIRDVTFDQFGLKRNNLSFNGARWWDNKLKKVTWDGFLDYGRSEWQHTFQKIKKKPTDEAFVGGF